MEGFAMAGVACWFCLEYHGRLDGVGGATSVDQRIKLSCMALISEISASLLFSNNVNFSSIFARKGMAVRCSGSSIVLISGADPLDVVSNQMEK